MAATLEQLRELSVSEKLQIVEQLWDDISDAEIPAIVQDWHKTEANRRRAELKADPSTALTRAELWQRVEETDE
jgi:putative addiction module component (TIGR02574 family)